MPALHTRHGIVDKFILYINNLYEDCKSHLYNIYEKILMKSVNVGYWYKISYEAKVI